MEQQELDLEKDNEVIEESGDDNSVKRPELQGE